MSDEEYPYYDNVNFNQDQDLGQYINDYELGNTSQHISQRQQQMPIQQVQGQALPYYSGRRTFQNPEIYAHLQKPLDSNECAICSEDFRSIPEGCSQADVGKISSLSCRHIFHKHCLDRWTATGQNKCPSCREQYDPTVSRFGSKKKRSRSNKKRSHSKKK